MNTALLLVDLQNDFFPGGALPAPDGDTIVAPVNQLIEVFQQEDLPTFATRDWHPRNHCSFEERGGPWPPHCIQGTPGADFNSHVNLPGNATVISKAQSPERDAYSGFDGTDLAWRLEALHVSDVVVGGLVTEICVKNTVFDALKRGLGVTVVREAVSGVDVHPRDSEKALAAMEKKGARIVSVDEAVLQLA